VIDRFRRELCGGETPVPCVECNRRSSSATCSAPRASSARSVLATGHYVARAAAGRRPRALSRRDDRARPELFPVRHHARAARLLRFPLGGCRKARRASSRAVRPCDRRQAGQPGHLLRADRALCRRDRAAAAGRRAPGDIVDLAAACSAVTTASFISPSASGRAWIRRARAALCGAARSRTRRVVVGPRARSRQR
jgi:hypothetical protein